ncbi:MAG: ATP-binding protein [Isosphaeraceae bacterium]
MKELSDILNPFRDTIVSDPWRSSATDVPEIHADVFKTCCLALEEVRSKGSSSSVLIHGEAGSGKTHLLARLRLHCKGVEARAVDPIQPETVFVAVRLQTGPQRLWRHLRRSFVEDLLREVDGETSQLERILLRRLGEIRQADAGAAGLKKTLDELFDRLSEELQLSRDLCTVLGHLMVGRHLRDARAWLMGDPLPESALSTLDLASSPDDDDLEDQAQRVVLDLCRLAGPKIPVVLCFDQIEALLVDPADQTPFAVLGQVIMKLFNETNNLLLISCVQSTFVHHLKLDQPGSVSTPAAARMAVHQTSLSPLRWDDAMRLIRARLSADSGLASLRESRAQTMWPLDEGELKQAVGARGCTPRKILSICAEKFDAVAKNREDRVPVEQFLARTWQERLEESSRSDTSGQVDHILTHGIPLLVHSSAQSWKLQGDRPSRDIDLMLEGPDGRLGISLSNHRDLRSLWPRLKRLPALIKDRRVEKLLLLRDVRLPIGKNAVKVNQLLEELCAQGAQFIRPSHEVLAALDALRRLLSDAKAGDLSNQGATVTPETVQEWLARNMPAVLQDLLEEIVAYPGIGGRNKGTELFDRIQELLIEQPVISVQEAATKLEAGAQDIEQNARANCKSVGVLDGPPVVLFRLVADEVGIE